MKKRNSVGIVIIARDTNRFLLLHRVKDPKAWSVLAGKMEGEENPVETIKREIREEIGVDAMMIDDMRILGQSDNGRSIHYIMVGYVDREFDIPKLKRDENDDYGWFSFKTLPSPLHPKSPETFKLIKPIVDLKECFKKEFNKLFNE